MAFLYYTVIAFSVWMLLDAFRRRVEVWWYVVILVVPFGSFIYFFAVKFKDFNLRSTPRQIATAGPELRELRARLEETPSAKNRLALADALEASGRDSEALPLFDAVLAQDPDNHEALHGRGRCLMSEGKFAEAVESFERLLEQNNAFRDYSAALDYAEALWRNDQRDDTIELLEGLVRVSTRINHHMALAHYLKADGRFERAIQVLKQGLSHFNGAPEFVKTRDGHWASRARDLLRSLEH